MGDYTSNSLTVRKTKHSLDLFDRLRFVHAPRPRPANGLDIKDEVGRLDEEMLMVHILDCVAAVAEKQRVRVALKKPLTLTPDGEALTSEQQASRNKVFKAAFSLLAEGLTHDGGAVDGKAVDDGRRAARELAWAFPDIAKQTDRRGWLPLHWAVAASAAGAGGGPYGVTEADVKAMYSLDPQALCRRHMEKDAGHPIFANSRFGGTPGFTPSHLLCMGTTTEQTKSLLGYFSAVSPRSFTMNVRYHVHDIAPDPARLYGALHVACKFGQPTEWLLQHLLQLDSSACSHQPGWHDNTSLGMLCKYSRGHLDVRLLQILLAADRSTAVVYAGVYQCLASEAITNRVEAVTLLLEATPQAAHHAPGGMTLSHVVCRESSHMSAQECIGYLQLLLPFTFMVTSAYNNELPIHWLAAHGSVEALEYLLDACPEVPVMAVMSSGSGGHMSGNLLHCVVWGGSKDSVAKARLLCARYPAMMLQRNAEGHTPLYAAIFHTVPDVVLALCEAGGREVAIIPCVHPTEPEDTCNGWLLLHMMCKRVHAFRLRESFVSPGADAFRLLLRLYPEAAGIEAGGGAERKTPYQLAVDQAQEDPYWAQYDPRDLPAYYFRVLLRAAPHLDPEELHRLNWAERRTAMYVAYAARFPKGTKPALLARLRLETADVVRHVVSFL